MKNLLKTSILQLGLLLLLLSPNTSIGQQSDTCIYFKSTSSYLQNLEDTVITALPADSVFEISISDSAVLLCTNDTSFLFFIEKVNVESFLETNYSCRMYIEDTKENYTGKYYINAFITAFYNSKKLLEVTLTFNNNFLRLYNL